MRVTLDLPDEFIFATEVPVLGLHLSFRHLDNALLLTLVSEARTRFIESLGYTEFDMAGVTYVVADALVVYKSEAFQGETLIIELTCRDFNKYGFDLVWRARDKASHREIARGKTGILCIDTEAGRPALIPDELVARLRTENTLITRS